MEPALRGSLDIIEEALERCQRPYVAFSGGKDSLVVAHLVSQVNNSVEMVYCDDELLYPECPIYPGLSRRLWRAA